MKCAFLLLIWILIYSLFRGTLQTKRGFERIQAVEDRLRDVKEDNLRLERKLEDVKSDDYRLKMVREKLRLQRQDEVVVVLPGYEALVEQNNETKLTQNWEKWLNLLSN